MKIALCLLLVASSGKDLPIFTGVGTPCRKGQIVFVDKVEYRCMASEPWKIEVRTSKKL